MLYILCILCSMAYFLRSVLLLGFRKRLLVGLTRHHPLRIAIVFCFLPLVTLTKLLRNCDYIVLVYKK
ncbi:hypothetical protein F4815DRAFT_452647 [Daldinia loculata]|nr:hypothetical protein F4815DRAFT_452647 [Daldinia loculata]